MISAISFERLPLGTFLDRGRVEAAQLCARHVAVITAVLETEVQAVQVAAGPTTIRDPQGKRLVADCLAGDAAARSRFHEQFGPLIYRFVACAGGLPVEAGDFYVYVFEDDRLYRRLRSYEGRASLEPFLRGFVLPDLLKRFQARIKKTALDTVSLDTGGVREPLGCLPSSGDPEADVTQERPRRLRSADLFEQLDPGKRLLIKLLYVEDFDLGAEDVQLIARRSGRPVREVVEILEHARESVRERERTRQAKLDEAESAAQWILQYTRRAARIQEALANVPPDSSYVERLRTEQAELGRKRAWREQQRDRARAQAERATVTLRYREIAHILNAPTGSVSAQVMRLRQELANLAAPPAREVKHQ